MNMVNDDWKTWPQLEFDIDYLELFTDWSDNLFGPNIKTLRISSRGDLTFWVAVGDPKILDMILLKFKCELRGNEYEKEQERERIRQATDAEIKRLLEELKAKIATNTDRKFKEAVSKVEKNFYTYKNGVWKNVEE